MDIPPLVLNHYFKIPVSVSMYVFDFCILLAQAVGNPPEKVLYGLILVMTYTLVLDKLMLMGTTRTEVRVISEHAQEIREAILAEMDRGVTMLSGETGYLKKQTQMIFSVISNREVPKIEKIVINMGLGEAKDNSKAIDNAVNDMTIISGQKPIVTKARKSIANFKLREGMPIGCKVTLRGEKMYSFASKLINIALPRVRDFRGVSANSFDGRGNYTLGIKEQLMFPEIQFDKIDKIRGMDIVFVTTANTDEEARELLRLFGMPFKK